MKVPRVFLFIMKYITPAYLIILLGFWFYQDGLRVITMAGVPPENYPYIWFARFLMIGTLIVAFVAVYIAWQKKHRIMQRIPSS